MNNTLAPDTNAIIYFLGANPSVAPLLDENIHYISVISEIEILGFNFKSQSDEYAVKRYLRFTKIIPLNSEIKEIAIRLKKNYKTKVGDSIVCATAIYFDMPLVSADKNFKKIKELKLVYFTP